MMSRTLPAGVYVISDPCYVIDREDYDVLLEETNYFGVDRDDICERGGGIFTDSRTGRQFAVLSTLWGDGYFPSNVGKSFPVDAGCIACVPIEMVQPHVSEDPGVMKIIMEQPFKIHYDEGTIIYGDVEIYTGEDGEGWDTQEDSFFD